MFRCMGEQSLSFCNLQLLDIGQGLMYSKYILQESEKARPG
jgi:hypothetical protein